MVVAGLMILSGSELIFRLITGGGEIGIGGAIFKGRTAVSHLATGGTFYRRGEGRPGDVGGDDAADAFRYLVVTKGARGGGAEIDGSSIRPPSGC